MSFNKVENLKKIGEFIILENTPFCRVTCMVTYIDVYIDKISYDSQHPLGSPVVMDYLTFVPLCIQLSVKNTDIKFYVPRHAHLCIRLIVMFFTVQVVLIRRYRPRYFVWSAINLLCITGMSRTCVITRDL